MSISLAGQLILPFSAFALACGLYVAWSVTLPHYNRPSSSCTYRTQFGLAAWLMCTFLALNTLQYVFYILDHQESGKIMMMIYSLLGYLAHARTHVFALLFFCYFTSPMFLTLSTLYRYERVFYPSISRSRLGFHLVQLVTVLLTLVALIVCTWNRYYHTHQTPLRHVAALSAVIWTLWTVGLDIYLNGVMIHKTLSGPFFSSSSSPSSPLPCSSPHHSLHFTPFYRCETASSLNEQEADYYTRCDTLEKGSSQDSTSFDDSQPTSPPLYLPLSQLRKTLYFYYILLVLMDALTIASFFVVYTQRSLRRYYDDIVTLDISLTGFHVIICLKLLDRFRNGICNMMKQRSCPRGRFQRESFLVEFNQRTHLDTHPLAPAHLLIAVPPSAFVAPSFVAPRSPPVMIHTATHSTYYT